MLKMIGLVPEASEVILRPPEAIFLRLKALLVAKQTAALRRSYMYIDAKRLVYYIVQPASIQAPFCYCESRANLFECHNASNSYNIIRKYVNTLLFVSPRALMS